MTTLATTTDQLFAQVAELRDAAENTRLLSQRMDQLSAKIAEMAVVLTEVRDKVLAAPMACPCPGLCLELRNRLATQENAMLKLQLENEVASRGWRNVGIIAGAILAVGGAIIGGWKIIEMFVHKKP